MSTRPKMILIVFAQNSKTFDDESHGTNERRYVTFTNIVIEQTIEMRSIDVLSKEQTRYPCECQFSLETFTTILHLNLNGLDVGK